MTVDLDQLADRAAAAAPTAVPPIEAVRHRVRRRRRRRAAAVALPLLLVVGLGAQVLATTDADGDLTVAASDGSGAPGTNALPPDAASQDAADARRDGVVPAVAALPTSARVAPIPEWFGTTTIDATEGTWVISSMDPERMVGVVNGCDFGDVSGTWGRDYVCLSQYVEILLLDDAGTILRAYPFSEITPQQLVLTDDAVYCARQGDGGVPDSLLCRIDRTTLDATVRIFPFRAFDEGIADQFSVPAAPLIDPPRQLGLWAELSAAGDELTITGQSGSATVDPDTLELTTIAAAE